MKSLKIFAAGVSGLIVAGTFVVSCTKNVQEATPLIDNYSNRAIVQLYVATVNASRNYIYVDAQAVNGSSLSSGSVFPGTGYGFNVATGLRGFTVRDTLSTTTQVPLTFAQNFQGGKTYTVFTYDTITTPLQKTVETNIVVPGDTTAMVRFANFIFSRVAVPNVDIFSKRRNINVFTNVGVTDVTDFTAFPSAFNDTLFVRETGTSNLLATLNGFNPTQKRSYTLVFRGRYQSTSGTVIRTLSSFVNR